MILPQVRFVGSLALILPQVRFVGSLAVPGPARVPGSAGAGPHQLPRTFVKALGFLSTTFAALLTQHSWLGCYENGHTTWMERLPRRRPSGESDDVLAAML